MVYRPSLDGHLRATLVPPHWISLSRECGLRLKDEDNAFFLRLKNMLDEQIRLRVVQGRRDLERHGWTRVLRCVAWRRLILWTRAKVAARRVILTRAASRW